jgi:hypothetical protein
MLLWESQMSRLLCPPLQFYESCCLQSTLLITYVVVSETSNTTHPVTQRLIPEEWGDKYIGSHILWRPYARYYVCRSRHGERFGVAIQFKPFGSNNLIHFHVTSCGKVIAEIGLWTGSETWVHHFIAQTKQAGMHFGLLTQCLGGCWLNNNKEVEVAVCEWLQNAAALFLPWWNIYSYSKIR